MSIEYHELSIHANIHLSICNISSLLHWLNRHSSQIKFRSNVDHTATYDIVLLLVSQLVWLI